MVRRILVVLEHPGKGGKLDVVRPVYPHVLKSMNRILT
jgi:hypothetical protein